MALCTCGVFSTATSRRPGISSPSSSQAAVALASNLFLYSASTQALATTFAPRSGVRAHRGDLLVHLLVGDDALLHQELTKTRFHELVIGERLVAPLVVHKLVTVTIF